MSHTRKKSFWEKIKDTRSLKGFASGFLKNTMLGQKMILHNMKIPRVINISMNEQTCMYRCRMCPYHEDGVREMYKSKSEMSFETLRNIVASVPNDPFYSFDISSIGETLCFKRLPEFIRYMKEKKPRVNTIISTNALLLSESLMKSLIESGLDNIQLSLYAHTREDYRWITGCDCYEKVKENTVKAAALRKTTGKKKPYMQTFMMGAKEFESSYPDFVEFWNRHVDHAFIRPLYNVGKKDLNGLTPDLKELPKRYPCVMPWYSTGIRSNGDVLACYNFHWYDRLHRVGNINENTLEAIWHNTFTKEFRKDHMEMNVDKYSACKDCILWDAYTDIWDNRNGRYDFKTRFQDLFTRAPDYRGG